MIALDGKTLKRNFEQLNDQAAASTLSAFASDDALILAHTELDGTTHEVAAVLEMIANLVISGILFTADALDSLVSLDHGQPIHDRGQGFQDFGHRDHFGSVLDGFNLDWV